MRARPTIALLAVVAVALLLVLIARQGSGGPSEDVGKLVELFRELGCSECHVISSLGVAGKPVGPDLSYALSGGDPNSPYSVIGRFFEEVGAVTREERVEALRRFLEDPPEYAYTMVEQVAVYRYLYGDNWSRVYVPALVRLIELASR